MSVTDAVKPYHEPSISYDVYARALTQMINGTSIAISDTHCLGSRGQGILT